MKYKIMLAALLLTVSGTLSAADTPPRPGIGDYLCHLFGAQHWEVCKPHPGKKP